MWILCTLHRLLISVCRFLHGSIYKRLLFLLDFDILLWSLFFRKESRSRDFHRTNPFFFMQISKFWFDWWWHSLYYTRTLDLCSRCFNFPNWNLLRQFKLTFHQLVFLQWDLNVTLGLFDLILRRVSYDRFGFSLI